MFLKVFPTGMKTAPGDFSEGRFDWQRGQDSNLRPLGYELASPDFLKSRASQTYRSRAISRPIYATTYHAISSVAPRLVHKSVHNTRHALFSADLDR
jgi:hypothetical protein